MSCRTAETVVRHSIVVEAPIERAFNVFVADFDRIKPREHNLLSVAIAETVFEPHVGGHIYDRGVDGSECRWRESLPMNLRFASFSAGTSVPVGDSRRIWRGRAKSRFASL